MKTDTLTTEVIDKIAVVTLGSPRKMYFDIAMGDALTEELEVFAGNPDVHVVIITGGFGETSGTPRAPSSTARATYVRSSLTA